MFEKHKAAKTLKKNKDVVELLDLQKTYLKQVDEKLAEADSTTDPAKKILLLHALGRYINDAESGVSHKQGTIAWNRADKKINKTIGVGAGTGIAALAIPAAILCPPVAIPFAVIYGAMIGLIPVGFAQNHIKKTQRERLVEQNQQALSDFVQAMTAQRTRAQEMLDETIKNCSLDEVSLSPRFESAFNICAPLRSRFAKAAADGAKRALEEKAAPQQDRTAPKKPVSYKVPKVV